MFNSHEVGAFLVALITAKDDNADLKFNNGIPIPQSQDATLVAKPAACGACSLGVFFLVKDSVETHGAKWRVLSKNWREVPVGTLLKIQPFSWGLCKSEIKLYCVRFVGNKSQVKILYHATANHHGTSTDQLEIPAVTEPSSNT